MATTRKLLIRQLDKKIAPFIGCEKAIVPDSGWMDAIRKTLNIPLRNIGRKLNKTSQAIKQMEQREASGAITLQMLRDYGTAMDLHFVYGFIPKNGSFEKMVHDKAEELAKKTILRTSQTMLENEANKQGYIQQAIEDLTQEIKHEMHKSLWE